MDHEHQVFVGHDDDTEYLLTTFHDGTRTIATRPTGSAATWSPPVTLTGTTLDEVCS